jgi:aspartyl-tRNA(Asn)/glutamyl-tRNA(Gln) amidotransferase subunit A
MLGAAELADAYRARTLSPVEVVDACLDAIAARNRELNAFLVIAEEQARAAAHASEARWRQGEPLGALDGVPVTVKDLCATIGLPARSGSLTTPDAPGVEDAPAVARLKEDGAILLGKTAMCEFGWKGVTDSPLGGVSRNPWDAQRTCGGSSGGAAIAAATGMGALHVGSDGAGSIRIPAAFCGVYGFKATFGRVPSYPPGRMALGHYGPLTRSVRDAALTLNTITRPDARDATALPYAAIDHCADLDAGIRGWRIAWCPSLCGATPDAEVERLTREAARMLVDLGASVDEIEPPVANPREHFEVMWAASMAQIYRRIPQQRHALLDPGFAAVARAGLDLTANRLLDAVAARLADGTAMNRFHERYDLLVTPQMPTTAFAAGVDFPRDQGMVSWLDWSPYTYLFNWTQQPAASIPCGIASDGLPVALQIAGARFAEQKVLRASRALERARPFAFVHDRSAR